MVFFKISVVLLPFMRFMYVYMLHKTLSFCSNNHATKMKFYPFFSCDNLKIQIYYFYDVIRKSKSRRKKKKICMGPEYSHV